MKNLICKKCGHKETLENINYSATSKILIAQVPRVRKKDGLDIYPLYCLKCNFITEWAADPNNISGKAVDGVEYFKTFKINKKYKEYFTDIEDNLVRRGYTNSEKVIYSIDDVDKRTSNKAFSLLKLKKIIVSKGLLIF